MIEFRVILWDKDGEFVSDVMMGANSLADEIAAMPVGSHMDVFRTAREENAPKGDE